MSQNWIYPPIAVIEQRESLYIMLNAQTLGYYGFPYLVGGFNPSETY